MDINKSVERWTSVNSYLKNLKKIEFVLTYACTGNCKHCSEGSHNTVGECMDSATAADAVRKITREYPIETVMTFGGEPLLCADTVYTIMNAAKESGVKKRQLITNGCFSRSESVIRRTAERLAECGVNDLLLSVDAFHQETIPLDIVKIFAKEAKKCDIPIRLQPAWLVSPKYDNPYNRRTRELLDEFKELGVCENEGNIVFPEGNAKIYLSEYFAESVPENPYIEDPADVRCISFSPNGDVLGGNVYQKDIMQIIKDYRP